MKLILTILILLLTTGFTYCQDIITLKNGDQIKCKIVEIYVRSIDYKKQDSAGAPVFSIHNSEIFAINYDNGKKTIVNHIPKPDKYKNKGFTNTTMVTPLISTLSAIYSFMPVNPTGYSVQSAFGAYLNDYFSLSGGIGIDNYRNFEMVPLFAEPRICFIKGRVTPTFTLDIGYAFALSQTQYSDYTTLKGAVVHPQVGVKIFITKKTALLFSVGYKTQYVNAIPQPRNLPPPFDESFFPEISSFRFNSFTFNAGLQF